VFIQSAKSLQPCSKPVTQSLRKSSDETGGLSATNVAKVAKAAESRDGNG